MAKYRKVKHAEIFWPGPTRLYDKDVDCGAVFLTGDQARALVSAYEIALERDPDAFDGHEGRWAESAANILRFNYGIGVKR